jgi:hypothetical protein
MKTTVYQTVRSIRISWVLIIIAGLGLTSCYIERGYDGMPGNAYLSLEWVEDAPSYLDAGTSDIPPRFEWGRYYLTQPGYYSLYYEGSFWDGWIYSFYAWEIDYNIYRNSGTPGGPGYNGTRGADTYLTILLSPYGPFTERWNKSLPSDGYTIREFSDDLITIESVGDEYTISITYRKVSKR